MDETYLTFWLWMYRIAAIGIACILIYLIYVIRKSVLDRIAAMKNIREVEKKIRELRED